MPVDHRFDARFGRAKSKPDAVGLSGGTGVKLGTTCERVEPIFYYRQARACASFGVAAKGRSSPRKEFVQINSWPATFLPPARHLDEVGH